MHVHGQTIERNEGVIIDESASIGRGRASHDLLRDYLNSARKLLLSEPPDTQVWVSVISLDSFGGVQDLVKGWTPEARGVFTGNLNRARRQLASALDVKTSNTTAQASGTDIFGALWHMKIEFESQSKQNSDDPVSKEIWLFSDMMNETKEFPMPQLLDLGPERMLERVKSSRMVVPLPHYKINVLGASTVELAAPQWIAMKRFWKMYFAAAGAEVVSYSSECDAQRN